MFNLNAKEAFKMMIDDKKVICSNGFVFERHTRNISKKRNNKHVKYLGYEDFLLEKDYSVFKEYVEPKKEPRIITFESYVGENTGFKPFNKCPVEMAFDHEVSRLCDDLNALKSVYEKVSKVKVTFEIIEENL